MTTALKDLETIYREILATVRYAPNEEGFIYKTVAGSDDRTPVIVQSKSLVFPCQAQLNQPDWAKRFAFHPMREDFSSGFSPVFEDYRRRLNFTLRFNTGYLMLAIADMATKDGAFQKTLPQNVADFLHYVKEGDEKFRDIIFGILAADPTKHKTEMEFVRINVQKGRKIDGVQHKRSAHLSFPILEKVMSHSKENKVDTIAGVSGIRARDRQMIQALYKLFFPKAETPEAYTTWSDSLQAPSMDCLMRAAAPLIENINVIAATLNGFSPNVTDLIIPYNWKSVFENLDSYTSVFNSIPMLNGNSGSGRVIDTNMAPPTVKMPSQDEILRQVQAEPTNGRTITVSQPTQAVAEQVVVAPVVQQPLTLDAPVQQPAIKLDNQMQPTTSPATLTTIRLDGPRGGSLQSTAQPEQQQPQVVKHDPTPPTVISQQAQPLFGNVPQQQPQVQQPMMVQQPVVIQQPQAQPMQQMPQGQPQVVNTAAGPIYVFPNGQSFTHQQLLALQHQQQIAAQTQGLQGLQQLGNNAAMQQLIAMNPQNAVLAAGVQMAGGVIPVQQPAMGMPGMVGIPGMVMQPQGMRNGTYQPLTQVQQVIPGFGQAF